MTQGLHNRNISGALLKFTKSELRVTHVLAVDKQELRDQAMSANIKQHFVKSTP